MAHALYYQALKRLKAKLLLIQVSDDDVKPD